MISYIQSKVMPYSLSSLFLKYYYQYINIKFLIRHSVFEEKYLGAWILFLRANTFLDCMYPYPEMSYGVDFKGFLNHVIWTVQELFTSDNTRIVNENIHFSDISFHLQVDR